jgi:uncharacterized delta-60 repeat protein
MENSNISISTRAYSLKFLLTVIILFLCASSYGQVSQQWASRYNGPGNNVEISYSIAVDGAGNVYTTGSSSGDGTGYDIATVKYNSAGVQQWVSRYNGTGNSDDIAYSIAVDGAGNVYVTGSSKSSTASGTESYITIKYTAGGTQSWARSYNGPGNSTDIAYSIAVDAAGNVYVTGASTGSGTSLDYATIKYDASGTVQWIQRYNGTGNNRDEASSLKIDASGNVYVTGYSRTGEVTGTENFTTIKYNSAGVQQWLQTYNGTGNNIDDANSIAVDAAGNVYVTGQSVGSATDYDFATVKYNSAGVQQWASRYNGAANSWDEGTSIAVDASGNVYVTGFSVGSGTDFDYASIKYNSAGVQQWASRYNGPAGTVDQAISVAVDASGNVYAGGWSYGGASGYDYAAIKYNSTGTQQWASRYNGTGNAGDLGTAMTIDAAGNIYIAGYSDGSGTNSDYSTVKYNSAGVQQWASRYNGAVISEDRAASIAVDGSGNVYVTGISIGTGTDYDYATAKYNSAGVQQWIQRYNGPANGLDQALSIAVDASGNVYVTGYSEGSGTSYDFATVKYNSSGLQQWAQRYNGPGNNMDLAYSVTVDASGNVYITGSSAGTGTGFGDFATIKYNSAGVQQWASRYNGPDNGWDESVSIAVDASGNVYVTGASPGTGSGDDYATIKYNSAGVQQWAGRYNGPGNSTDRGASVKVDAAGNVYVTGRSTGTGSSDYATIKYSAAGSQQWVSRYNGPGNSIDQANSIAVDASGNVYVTGQSSGSGTGNDYATLKYNSTGVQQWASRYNGTGNSLDEATSIAVDAAGNVYVSGQSIAAGTGDDYTTIKYSPAGAQLWLQRYNGPANSGDQASQMVIDAAGNVYVTGGSEGNGTSTDYATIKYSQMVGIEPVLQEIPSSYSLEQNYPNPFNPNTIINFQIPAENNVKLTVFDITGREIVTLINENLKAGTYKADFDGGKYSTGVYFYKLTAGNFNETKKMLMIR